MRFYAQLGRALREAFNEWKKNRAETKELHRLIKAGGVYYGDPKARELLDRFFEVWQKERNLRRDIAIQKQAWEQKPVSPEQILIVKKPKRRVKSKKKLTAGKHGKKIKTKGK